MKEKQHESDKEQTFEEECQGSVISRALFPGICPNPTAMVMVGLWAIGPSILMKKELHENNVQFWFLRKTPKFRITSLSILYSDALHSVVVEDLLLRIFSPGSCMMLDDPLEYLLLYVCSIILLEPALNQVNPLKEKGFERKKIIHL